MNGVLSGLVNFVIFIIAFGLLVFLHEFGHYLMSKLFHIEVEEFGFGFPPRMVKLFQFHETEFTLNWIPFGAFVRPKGENDPNVTGGLAAASPWARLLVLFGGPLMNLITGILLFSLVFTKMGAPDTSKVLIVEVNSGSPAQSAGLQVNDVVQKINDTAILSTAQLSTVVHENLGKDIAITVDRGGKQVVLHAMPRQNPPAGQGALGITMSNPYRPMNWLQSLPYATQITYQQGRALLTLPFQLLSGQASAQDARFVGPKGIFDIYSAARTRDQQETTAAANPSQGQGGQSQGQTVFGLGLNTLGFLATISIALGFTNLLPIPALDGGRILFVLPEILLRRRVPAQYENAIHLIGFTLLILLMIYVTTQDFINPVINP